jgi:hypothetical protein
MNSVLHRNKSHPGLKRFVCMITGTVNIIIVFKSKSNSVGGSIDFGSVSVFTNEHRLYILNSLK